MNLNQITISSTDVARSVVFYKQLGLQLIVDSAPRYVRFVCPAGDSTFSIHQEEQPAQYVGTTIYFECKDVDAEYKRLLSAGVQFATAPTDQEWLWREARLQDPDGHWIILYHAGDNRKNPPWRIN
ncbi:bleomycin resistance protein [Reichenbachiella sp. 5M10]|uniref:VOC family protein n=1 Tax=Reichenbachiella sp. 5M10 TaxID=1889772 RepID=UPI000C161256|nr:VOC family protein [Reichenbachiella sp. 5M10]PIB36838.1 bleomycin resistance protein [Reichenbachiella sp. 5M10]